MDFTDQVVVVTGSTQHTGLALALAFLDAGARVVINGEQKEQVDQLYEQLSEKYGEHVFAVKANVADAIEVEQLFKMVEEKWGELDVLVNNACLQAVDFNFMEASYEDWKRVVDVNLNGMFIASQQAARMMSKRGGGVIVNIGSTASTHAIRSRSPYVASKGGVDALTRAMALDLADYSIRVNSVVPGYVRTTRWDNLDEEEVSRRRSNIPLNQETLYEDVAGAVMFLASKSAKNITGTRLVVDGGLTSQLVPKHNEASMKNLKK